MNSIIQADKEHCFLCGGRANSIEPLDEHHIFGGNPNRKLSEKYGLKVYLHHNKCHIFGKYSVHANAETANKIKRIAQQRAMQHYGWDIDQFREIFGKNYL